MEKRTRFHMFTVLVTTCLGVLFVFLALLGLRMDVFGIRLANSLFLVAASLIGGSAIYVALSVPRIPKVTPAVLAGAAVIIFSQIINVADEMHSLRFVPILGREGWLWRPYLDDMLLFLGLGILLTASYLAILDATIVRLRMTEERDERARALREVERYAGALQASERAVRAQLMELDNLYSSAPVGLSLIDAEMRFRRVNRHWELLDGIPAERHLGQTVGAVLGEGGRALAELCGEVLRTNTARSKVELCLPAGEGGSGSAARRQQTWLVSCYPLHEHVGQVTGVQVVVLDMSDVKAAQERQRLLELQVQQSQKLESLGVLAGGIAHDFNNLLTGILGNTSLVSQRARFDDKTRVQLAAIEEMVGRAADLTHQMLAYAGEGTMQARFVDLAGVMREALPLLRASVTRSARLNVRCDDGMPPVVGDPAQLRQVLLNLVINASEALNGEGGRVDVRVYSRDCTAQELGECVVCDSPWPGKYVCIEVQDSGAGMERAAVSRIFEPFYSTKFTGRGLGLAVVVGIVRKHRGAIQVESEVGQGTVFRVLLPSSQVTSRPPEEVRSGGEWRGHGLVLVIDDEVAVQETVAIMLEDMGFDVVRASDGREGEATFTRLKDQLSAVLLDLTMPGQSGQETYHAIRRIDSRVPVILSSGYNEEQVRRQFEGEDSLMFLPKPYSYDRLSSFLRRVTQASPQQTRIETPLA